MAKYLNLDKIVPEEQILEIAGRRFDISQVPARKTTELIRVGAWATSDEIKNNPSKKYEAYEKEMQALLDVLGEDQDGNPAEFNWVMDNVTNAQFAAILDFVAECIRGENNEVADGETPANFTPSRAQRRAKARKK